MLHELIIPMYYKEINLGDATIEFLNDWLGRETIKVNGQEVSKKSSIMGTNHDFTIMEDGEQTYYILTTKVNNNMEVALDIRRNGLVILENVPVPMTFHTKELKNPLKKSGVAKVKNYEINDGIADLKEALRVKADDPEIYFYMACAYSIQENTKEGFECLKQSVEHNLQEPEIIKTYGMLAFLRMQEGFE